MNDSSSDGNRHDGNRPDANGPVGNGPDANNSGSEDHDAHEKDSNNRNAQEMNAANEKKSHGDGEQADSHKASADSLSDEEIDAAFASFEEDFNKQVDGDFNFGDDDTIHPAGTHRNGAEDDADSSDQSGSDSEANASNDVHGSGADDSGNLGEDGTDGLDIDPDFTNELEGLIGDKVKVAVIITRIASAELLAAFCRISDISARCIESSEGAVAVLDTHEADGPEHAAQDLTDVVSGLSVVLAVNRANKLNATLWMRGQSGEEFAPPILFASSAPFVEDIMIGTVSVDSLKQNGITVVNTDDVDHDQAMGIIARHMRLGPDSSAGETGE
ncbi:hypothetical protein [Bifidobacterium aquikefiricola]|uniref:Uncharacterized protein n=1 Tax=Bifidobacterium aquikefiricola TaxID=3059038 RepID=A0AB39U8Y5_9BIFI